VTTTDAAPSNLEALQQAAASIEQSAETLAGSRTPDQSLARVAHWVQAVAAVMGPLAAKVGTAPTAGSATTSSSRSAGRGPQGPQGPVAPASDVPPPMGVAMPNIMFQSSNPPGWQKDLSEIEQAVLDVLTFIAGAIGGTLNLGSIEWRSVQNWFESFNTTTALAPPDLADMVERNVLSFDEAAKEATLSGIGPERFTNLVLNTGEPPGVVEMLSLLRRGLIDEDEFGQAVAYSRIRTQYLPQLLQLAYSSMSPADAVEAYVKGIIPEPEAETLYEHGGGLKSQWDILKEAAGDAIGVERACALEAHGDISADELKKVILRSRINPMFEPIASLGNNKWLSAYQIGTMLSTGAATPQQATLWLTQDGYPSDQVAALVAAKSGQGIHKTKQEALSTILTGYEAGWLTPGQATEGIEGLGYPAEAVPALLALHDNRRIVATMDAAVTRVRAAVLARKIDWTKARAELASIGISAGVINHYVQLWQIEMDTEVRTLTSAQIGSLARKGHITEDVAKQKWVAMGYSQDDAGLLWMEYQPSAASLKAARPAPAATS